MKKKNELPFIPLNQSHESREGKMTHKFAHIFIGIVIAVSTIGCAQTVGNKQLSDQATLDQVKKGLTKDQVRNLLGEPFNVSNQGDTEMWSYREQTVGMNAWALVPFSSLMGKESASMQHKMLTVVFDKKGTVSEVNKNFSNFSNSGR